MTLSMNYIIIIILYYYYYDKKYIALVLRQTNKNTREGGKIKKIVTYLLMANIKYV